MAYGATLPPTATNTNRHQPPPTATATTLQERLHVSLARALLTCPDWRARLDAVSHLHPERLCDLPGGVDGAAVAAAREAYGEDVERIVGLHAQADAARGGGMDAGPLAAPDDVLRLILAVQCNAFYSGFHVHCSMFNHCCDPSCIKLALSDGSSEVRALREMQPGEECTISYLSPPLQVRSGPQPLVKHV
jgi:hypothetical protein